MNERENSLEPEKSSMLESMMELEGIYADLAGICNIIGGLGETELGKHRVTLDRLGLTRDVLPKDGYDLVKYLSDRIVEIKSKLLEMGVSQEQINEFAATWRQAHTKV